MKIKVTYKNGFYSHTFEEFKGTNKYKQPVYKKVTKKYKTAKGLINLLDNIYGNDNTGKVFYSIEFRSVVCNKDEFLKFND